MKRGWTVIPVVTMFLLAACQGGDGDDASQGADGSGAAGEGIAVDEDGGQRRPSAFSGIPVVGRRRRSCLHGDRSTRSKREVSEHRGRLRADPRGLHRPDDGAVQRRRAPGPVLSSRPSSPTQWMEDGLLEPLEPYFAGNPQFDTEPFFDPLIQAFEYEGQTYGLPKDAAHRSRCSTTRTCSTPRASSLRPPGTSSTAAAEALTTDDVYGLCLGAELPRVGAFIYQNGRRRSTTRMARSSRSRRPSRSRRSTSYLGTARGGNAAWSRPTPAPAGAARRSAWAQAAMTMEGNWLYPADGERLPGHRRSRSPSCRRAPSRATLTFTVAYSHRCRFGEQGGRVGAAPVPDRARREWPSGRGRGLALPSRDDVEPAPRARGARRPASSTPRRTRFARDFPDIQAAFNAELTRVLAEGRHGTGRGRRGRGRRSVTSCLGRGRRHGRSRPDFGRETPWHVTA